MSEKKQPFRNLVLLILAGEAIFVLPFVLARVFRPTFLDVFELNNLELGICFSIYGIIAMLSYLFGGVITDMFKPRKLISAALILTALGGLVMSTYPSYNNMKLLFGYWGFTTIFLFWAALIKATRIWGGTKRQGIAFGFLDGGRGLVAAGFGSLGVLVFSIFIDVDPNEATLEQRKFAFRNIILVTSFLVGFIGLLVYLFMKTDTDPHKSGTKSSDKLGIANLKLVIRIKPVRQLMIIILCAYVGYKITDIFSLYAKEVMLYNEIKAAQIGAFLLYLRPIVGVSIGLLADRSKASLWLIIGFMTMLIGALLFSSGWIEGNAYTFFFLSLIIVATGTYAVRVLYFATLEEANIPLTITGSVIGAISLIGYTPDIFMGPAMGYLLDSSPGKTGHQHVFIMLAVFAVVGLFTSIMFRRTLKNSRS